MISGDGAGGPRVCVDASLVLGWVLPAERSPERDSLLQEWEERGVAMLGPALLYAEATSVMRLRVATGRLTPEQGEAALRSFDALGIRRIDRADLHRRAWELAKRYQRPRAYDMFYLALAQIEQAPLWTSDARLAHAVAGHETLLHYVPVLPAA